MPPGNRPACSPLRGGDDRRLTCWFLLAAVASQLFESAAAVRHRAVETAHFVIYYDTAGAHAAREYQSGGSGSGSPYVDSIARLLEENHIVLTQRFGMPAPLTGEPYRHAKYPVVLEHLPYFDIGAMPTTALGMTEEKLPWSGRSVIYLENDLNIGLADDQLFTYILDSDTIAVVRCVDQPWKTLKLVVAHELFHASQIGLCSGAHLGLLRESGPSWFQHSRYPDIEPFWFLARFAATIEHGIFSDDSAGSGYEQWRHLEYLHRRFGDTALAVYYKPYGDIASGTTVSRADRERLFATALQSMGSSAEDFMAGYSREVIRMWLRDTSSMFRDDIRARSRYVVTLPVTRLYPSVRSDTVLSLAPYAIRHVEIMEKDQAYVLRLHRPPGVVAWFRYDGPDTATRVRDAVADIPRKVTIHGGKTWLWLVSTQRADSVRIEFLPFIAPGQIMAAGITCSDTVDPRLDAIIDLTSAWWWGTITQLTTFTVDLGSVKQVVRTTIEWAGVSGVSFDLLASKDSLTWDTLDRPDVFSRTYSSNFGDTISCRYMRLEVIRPHSTSSTQFGIDEWRFFGPVVPVSVRQNAAAPQPVAPNARLLPGGQVEFTWPTTGVLRCKLVDMSGRIFSSNVIACPGGTAIRIPTVLPPSRQLLFLSVSQGSVSRTFRVRPR